MFRRVPSSIRRYLRVFVLLVVAQSVFNLQDALTPFELLLNCPGPADSQNENEREETELAGAFFSPAHPPRHHLPRHMMLPAGQSPPKDPGIDHRSPFPVSFDPARDHIASGAGIFQRC